MKKIISVLCAITLMLSGFGFLSGTVLKAKAEIDYTCGENLTWNLNTKTGELVISGTGYMYDYNQYFDGSTTDLPPWYDYRNDIKSITLDVGITSIGRYAFQEATNVTEITVPHGITKIGDGAFRKCQKLKSIYLPSTLKTIYVQSFLDTKSLENIVFPNGTNVETVGGTFYETTSCKWYNSLPDGPVVFCGVFIQYKGTIPENAVIQVPEGTKVIRYGLFENNMEIESIILPDGLTTIQSNAFYGCSGVGEDFVIPDSVYAIGEEALAETPWLESKPEGMVYAGKVAYTYKGTMDLEQKIVLQEGTIGVADCAFNNNPYLADINLPNSLVYIGKSAFKSTNISGSFSPKNVKFIGLNAFAYTDIEEIIIPSTIENMEGGTFTGCRKLKSVEFEESYSFNIIPNAFIYGCESLNSFKVPECVTCIDNGAFGKNPTETYHLNVTIPKSVTKINGNIFNSNKNVTVYCYKDSTAHNYVVENGYPFVLIDGNVPDVDLTQLNEVIAIAEGINRNLYSYESVEALDSALNSVNPDTPSLTQSQVNKWKNAINDAIKNLKYKPADYYAVEMAKKRANEINRSFYTPQSLVLLDETIDSVDMNLDITNQSIVNSYARNINEAVDNLEYLPADYTEVYNAISNSEKYNRDLYTAESLAVLDLTVNGVDYSINISQQNVVDGYATGINSALANLKYKPADYAEINTALARVENIDRSLYTAESLEVLDNAIDAVNKNLDITQQDEADAYAKAINDAVEGLEYRSADYVTVNSSVEKANGVNRLLYTVESLEKLDDAVNAVDYSLDITKQSKVNGFAEKINSAIDALKYLPADYSAVEAVINTSNLLDRRLYSQATLAVLDQSISAVDYTLNITQQDKVDLFAENINTVINSLEYAEIVLRNEPNGVIVSATAKEIDPDTALTVDLKDPSNLQTGNFAVGGTVKSLTLYDINLLLNAQKTQPNGFVNVKIKLPDGVDPKRCKVYHVTDDPVDPLIRYTTTLEGNFIVFETDHFSEFAVIEVETVINSIEITKLPNKTDYLLCETVVTGGMEVTAHFSDGSSVAISDYDVSSVDTSSIGTKTVTVYYTYNGVTKSVSFNITVTGDKITASITSGGKDITEYNKKVSLFRGYNRESLQLGYSLSAPGNYKAEWLSDNEKVLVDSNGKVTNKGFFFARKATITLKITDSAGNVIATDTMVVRFYKLSFQLPNLQTVTNSFYKKFFLIF